MRKNEKAFVFLVMKTSKNIESVCHKMLSRDADLLLIVEEGKMHYVRIKDFEYIHVWSYTISEKVSIDSKMLDSKC